MSNLKEHAFPALIDIRSYQERQFDTLGGFSKHEIATIMIASGMASSFATPVLSREMLDAIAEDANYLAARILKQFE